MTGYVIYNGFWNPNIPPDPVRRLVAAGEKRGLSLAACPNTSLPVRITETGLSVEGITPADVVLFWDKDIRLGEALEGMGVRVFNPIRGVELCDNKGATHLALAKAGIFQPRTLLAPMTYREVTDQIDVFLTTAAQELSFPMVVKECYGSLGGQVYLAHDPQELRELAMGMGSKPFLVQEFVAPSAGRDHRLYVVGERVVAAMHRCSAEDFRSNIAGGGRGEAYIPTPEEEVLAIQCCRLLGLDFGGVDLLWDEDGTPLVCEVNSNAFMEGIIACTGVDVADEIIRYVLPIAKALEPEPA